MMKILLVLLASIILISCEGGLAPHDGSIPKSFISGKITYLGGISSWPPKDSLFAIRVVAFKIFPPKDIITEIASGNAYFTVMSLPLNVDTSSFRIEIPNPPVELQYIAVAQQYTNDILSQRAVGVYTKSGDNTKPSSILITRGKYFDSININVDFKNLPPQPFE